MSCYKYCRNEKLKRLPQITIKKNYINLSIRSRTAPPYAPADGRRHQRAARVSLLPQDILLLLFTEATLPRQARAVGHAVRVRVLPPEVPDQELADDAQEPAAPRLQRHAEAAAEDVGAARRAGARAAPVRPGRRRARAAAARPAMTGAGGLGLHCAALRTLQCVL